MTPRRTWRENGELLVAPIRHLLACIPAALFLAACPAPSAEPAIPDAKLAAAVDARLAEWWLKPDERRFDRVGWAGDLRTARRLAAESGRPLFLFTMDGRVNTGRC